MASEQQKIITPKISQAYVKAEDRVLDPEKLEGSILERMPQPTGYRILVLPCH